MKPSIRAVKGVFDQINRTNLTTYRADLFGIGKSSRTTSPITLAERNLSRITATDLNLQESNNVNLSYGAHRDLPHA
nr:hypothetical protein [Lentzea atacamensis]